MRSHKGFTIIEVMVAILIFTVWFLWAYSLVRSAMNLSLRSKQEILAANLIREQIELVKSIRDTNYLALRNWNSLKGLTEMSICSSAANCELSPGYYTIQNRYTTQSPIALKKIATDTFDAKTKVSSEANAPLGSSEIRLCIDELGRYTHDCVGAKSTPYYTFVQIEEVKDSVWVVPSALAITAVLATTEWGYREYTMHTILTDWKK